MQFHQDADLIEEYGDKLALSELDVDPDIETVDQEDELEIEIDQDNPLDEFLARLRTLPQRDQKPRNYSWKSFSDR